MKTRRARGIRKFRIRSAAAAGVGFKKDQPQATTHKRQETTHKRRAQISSSEYTHARGALGVLGLQLILPQEHSVPIPSDRASGQLAHFQRAAQEGVNGPSFQQALDNVGPWAPNQKASDNAVQSR
ncbi:hypothetical protein CYMTET_43998 [Cymbomonas tetramitiformis]|uniref:Uncharacterized protein n=1 Tax=Cymbomonas tetramitiformis TaxID=36881 RepID=A0AAE0C290_9CHLO|nr:hypothetical protein CYMTET_43998 [Cymbomonas tetramitiformis]